MILHTLSRRTLMLAAAASIGIPVTRAAQASSPSMDLCVLQDKLLVARAERDRLHQIVRDAEGKRPPKSESLGESIKDPHSRLHHVHSNDQLWLGQLDPVGAYETDGGVAHHLSDFDRQTIALEAAECVVCDIERALIDFEPRSIADLRVQVELALHQEIVDYGMDENLPRLICERFLRLIPARSVSRRSLQF
jgi:hypothetical protein